MEQRRAKRWRARLHSGKLFDTSRRFLAECRVIDLSQTGARLQVLAHRPLPMNLNYRSDGEDEFRPAALVWARSGEIGIRFAEIEKHAGRGPLLR